MATGRMQCIGDVSYPGPGPSSDGAPTVEPQGSPAAQPAHCEDALLTEAERVKPRSVYAEEAVAHALDSRWQEALTANRAVLERYGPDEDAYNRLGKAYTELGDLKEALAAYSKTIELNPLNVIAGKNFRKLQSLIDHAEKPEGSSGRLDVDLFTEEPGKSGLTLLNPPSGGVGVKVAPGDTVSLEVEGSTLHVRTSRSVLIGDVDPKIARRLLPLLATGNQYSGAVARVDDERGTIEVMIRETHQAPENARKSSFQITRTAKRDDFRPYAKESLLVDRGGDDDGLLEEETERLPAAGGVDELEGMQTVEGEFEDPAGVADEDDDDDDADIDTRPEDEY